jgi:hypothetical protein
LVNDKTQTTSCHVLLKRQVVRFESYLEFISEIGFPLYCSSNIGSTESGFGGAGNYYSLVSVYNPKPDLRFLHSMQDRLSSNADAVASFAAFDLGTNAKDYADDFMANARRRDGEVAPGDDVNIVILEDLWIPLNDI